MNRGKKFKIVFFLILFFGIFAFGKSSRAACFWDGSGGDEGACYNRTGSGPGHYTYTTIGCGQDAVWIAIDKAVDGDVISIPGGTCTWDWTMPVKKGIEIHGQSCSLGTVNNILNLPTTCPTAIRGVIPFNITGDEHDFRMHDLALNVSGGGGVSGTAIYIDGNFNTIRLYNLLVNSTGTRVFALGFSSSVQQLGWYGSDRSIYNRVKMLFDHINFSSSTGAEFLIGFGRWQTWIEDDDYGTDDSVFIEDSSFYYPSGNRAVTDYEGGGRFVFRHNFVNDGGINMHDVDNPPRRGNRVVEVYSNSFNCDNNCDSYGVGPLVNRGGSGLYYNNQVSGWYLGAGHQSGGTGTEIKRLSDGYAYNYCYSTGGTTTVCEDMSGHCSGGAREACLHDSDCTGNSSGTCGGFISSCTTDADCGYAVTGARCVLIDQVGGTGTPPGYPCRDQIGRGKDDPNTRGQTSNPLFNWKSGPERTCMSGGVCTAMPWSNNGSAYITEGIDYCNHDTTTPCNGVRINYTPYTYPHPLQGLSDTTPPAAPTGLSVK